MLIKTLLPFLLPAAAPGDKTAGKTKILHMNHPSSKITFCKKITGVCEWDSFNGGGVN